MKSLEKEHLIRKPFSVLVLWLLLVFAVGPANAEEQPCNDTAPCVASPVAPLTLGLHADMNFRPDTSETLALVANSGASSVRADVLWSAVERTPGLFKWSRYDAIFETAASQRLRVLPVLVSPPRWAAPRWNTIPASSRAFGGFAAHAAARYGPGGTFWKLNPDLPQLPATHFEVWNEPYIAEFSASGVDPGTYARFFKGVVTAAQPANPAVKWLIQSDEYGHRADGSLVEWVDAMYDAVPDLNSYFDAVAVHPYSPAEGPDLCYRDPENPDWDEWNYCRIDMQRATYLRHGAADKPFWITEVGWPSCFQSSQRSVLSRAERSRRTKAVRRRVTGRRSPRARGRASSVKCRNGVTESTRAAHYERQAELVAATPWVHALFFYELGDDSPAHGDAEGWYGIVSVEGRRTRSYQKVQAIADSWSLVGRRVNLR